MNTNIRTRTHIINNHITITMKTSHKASHRKGHTTIVKVITVIGPQQTALIAGLIREKEMNLMIIISGQSMEDK